MWRAGRPESLLIAIAALAALFSLSSQARSGTSDSPKWDAKLDAPIAAPASHKVIFENENIRVQSVTIAPGAEEPRHVDPYPSVVVIDSMPTKAVDRDDHGNAIKDPGYAAVAKSIPLVALQLPCAPHSWKNSDPSKPVHFIRVEFKKGDPQLLSFPEMGPIAKQRPLPISTNGTDPATWDPQKASAIAAPKNHKIVFENEYLRVISVTIPRGSTEPQHDHPYYSLLLIDSDAHDVDHDLTGKIVMAPQIRQARIHVPFAFFQPPQSLHAVEDQSTDKDGHLIRIEFKKDFKLL